MNELLDIIIPTHGRGDWLRLCLTAIRSWTNAPYRIQLVDNRNTDADTLDVIERARCGEFGACSVHIGQNKSFSNSVNLGARGGKAPNIVILNSDAIVTPGWDSHFLSDLADKKVGLTGARSNAASGLQSDSSGVATTMDPSFLVFVCVAMRREVFEQLGGLDEETFQGFSCEDLDFSWTVKKNGGRLKLSNAYVLHGLSQTLQNTVGGAEARLANDRKWQAKLIEKWGIQHVIEETRLRPRVMVCTFSAEEWTRVNFAQAMFGLRRATAFDLDLMWHRRLPIHHARQAAVDSVFNINEQLRATNQLTFTHILMLDDDHVDIPQDVIMRLLAHKKDVVGTIAYQRSSPHMPCVFELAEDKLHCLPIEIEHTGLRKVDAMGFPLVLIKVSVFERLKEFYVEQAKKSGETDLSKLQGLREKGKKFFGAFEEMGEDLKFCARCREAGIDLYVDTDIILGHMGDPINVNESYRKAWKAQQGK